jgi:hypothetical protein
MHKKKGEGKFLLDNNQSRLCYPSKNRIVENVLVVVVGRDSVEHAERVWR